MLDYRMTLRDARDIEAATAVQHGAPAVGVKVRFAPDGAVDGLQFTAALVADSPLLPFVPAIRSGIAAAMQDGRGGIPVTGVRAELVFGWASGVAANDAAFARAAWIAFGCAAEGNRVLLEPMTAIEVEVPLPCAADVVNDLTMRWPAARPDTAPGEAGWIRVSAQVPTAELTDYGAILAALSQGKGRLASRSAGHRRAAARTLLAVLAERDAFGSIRGGRDGAAQ